MRRSRARFANEAAAQAALDAFDWTPHLKDMDFADLLIWVESLNTVASFDLTGRDITEEEGEDFIAGTFSESSGDEAIRLAWWVESITPPIWTVIHTRIGWTSEQGTDVQDRAISLNAAEPLYDATVEVP